jgi:dipeptidase
MLFNLRLMQKYLASCLFLILSAGILGQSAAQLSYNCFTMIAGKDATEDGSVMLAHNEDGPGFIMINWYKVPHLMHSDSVIIRFHSGAEIKESPETNAYLWLEMPAHSFSDSYMNEYGVVITSNQCLSREDKPVLKDGGIGYELRKLMTERAHTARSAVKLAGKLIDLYGYNSSGRTYSIADNQEAWMLSVVNGKHWVARRIPDNEVAVIPNYYTISEVDLNDTMNYLGSSDLISYAEARGWCDPNDASTFNFRKVYSDQENLLNQNNIARHWQALNILSEKHFRFDDVLPFSIIPQSKINLQLFRSVLSDHYQGTPLEKNDDDIPDPHINEIMRICSDRNQYGFIAQLRRSMPVEIGAVLWIAPRYPCMHPFIPWYSGIISVPAEYTDFDYLYAMKHHFDESRKSDLSCKKAYCRYLNFGRKVNADYMQYMNKLHPVVDKRQQELIRKQVFIENKLLKLYATDKNKSLIKMTDYSCKQARKELTRLKKI